MTLTTYNGQVAVKCMSLGDVEKLTRVLHNDGFGTKLRLIKAKRNRHPRHFFIMVYPPWV